MSGGGQKRERAVKKKKVREVQRKTKRAVARQGSHWRMLLLCCSFARCYCCCCLDDDCLGVVVQLSIISLLATAFSFPHSFIFFILNSPRSGKRFFLCKLRRVFFSFQHNFAVIVANEIACYSRLFGRLKSISFHFPFVSHSNRM